LKQTNVCGIVKMVLLMLLESMKGIGPKGKKLLNQMGIHEVEDLLTFYPFRYESMKKTDLSTVMDQERVVVEGVIETLPHLFYFRSKMNQMQFQIQTDSRLLKVVIYNRAFMKRQLVIGKVITVIGKYDKT